MGGHVAFWGFGHTHHTMDVVRRGTRVVTNACGYPGEHMKDWNPEFVVEIKEIPQEKQ